MSVELYKLLEKLVESIGFYCNAQCMIIEDMYSRQSQVNTPSYDEAFSEIKQQKEEAE